MAEPTRLLQAAWLPSLHVETAWLDTIGSRWMVRLSHRGWQLLSVSSPLQSFDYSHALVLVPLGQSIVVAPVKMWVRIPVVFVG